MKLSITRSSRSGQSIIEAMVALSILTTGLLGIMTLLTRSFQINDSVDNQTTATYLAAEGIEVAKSLIDHDVYANIASGGVVAGWGNCFSYASSRPIYIKLDYETYDCSDATLQPSLTPTEYPIYYNTSYAYSNFEGYRDTNIGGIATKTIFSRSTSITAPNSNELDVQSTVSWMSPPGVPQSVTLEDHFYNWIPAN